MTVDGVARRRDERRARKLEQQLKAHQAVIYGTDEIDDVDEWRKELGPPVAALGYGYGPACPRTE